MKRKPCKQSKLPLTCCFHQPGTACVINLSIYSIVDSEGVEYVHQSEDCTCIVEIIDRDQHGGVELRDRGVRMKEPSSLRFTGPLATKQFLKWAWKFKELYLHGKHKKIRQVSKQIRFQNVDMQVFSLCSQALSEIVGSHFKPAEKVLKKALAKVSNKNCENSLLLRGRVLRHFAFLQHSQGNSVKALDYIQQAKESLSNAAPSYETAHAFIQS